MKKLFLLLLFITAHQLVQAQVLRKKQQAPARNNVLKVSNLGAATAPLRNDATNRFGLGLHHEKLVLDRVSVVSGATYMQSGFGQNEGAAGPFQAANQSINVNTGVRTYLRLRKKNHHNGLFTGLNANYQYRHLDAQNDLHMVGVGVPLGYQKKLFRRFTVEAQLTPVYNLWSNSVPSSAEYSRGGNAVPKVLLNSHIGFGYAF